MSDIKQKNGEPRQTNGETYPRLWVQGKSLRRGDIEGETRRVRRSQLGDSQ